MGLFPRTVVSWPANLPQGPTSNVFFVDYNNGSDNNPGTKREQPLESIAAAIALCDDAQSDTIFVTSQVHVEDQPIVVDVQAVRIIGLPVNQPHAQQARTWIFPDAHVTGGVFTISAGDVTIENFMLWSTAGQPCIDFGVGATDVRNVIKNCSFHLGSYGVMTGPAANQPSHYLSIVDCMFGPGLDTGGILHASNGSWPLIADCFFETIPGPNISVTGGIAGGRIERCLFMLDSDTEGEAITMGAGPTRWWIVDNVANDNTTAAITANPFLEQGDDNAWCGNSKGGGARTGIAPA